MTKREIFETVKTHLLSQNAKSEDKDTHSCKYRGPGSLKCAVGVLIPNEMYSEMMEGFGVNALVSEFPSLPAMFKENVVLLRALQRVHDGYQPAQWRDMLEGVRLSLVID